MTFINKLLGNSIEIINGLKICKQATLIKSIAED